MLRNTRPGCQDQSIKGLFSELCTAFRGTPASPETAGVSALACVSVEVVKECLIDGLCSRHWFIRAHGQSDVRVLRQRGELPQKPKTAGTWSRCVSLEVPAYSSLLQTFFFFPYQLRLALQDAFSLGLPAKEVNLARMEVVSSSLPLII